MRERRQPPYVAVAGRGNDRTKTSLGLFAGRGIVIGSGSCVNRDNQLGVGLIYRLGFC
jgi:hypothetical protein